MHNTPHSTNLHLNYTTLLSLYLSWWNLTQRSLVSLSTFSLHLHPESLLPLSGGHPGSPLQHGHWHVEPGLHPCRALHRLSPLPGREWSRANSLHHGGVLHKYLTVLYLLHCSFPAEFAFICLTWCCDLQVLGMPPNDFVQTASRRRLFFGEEINFLFLFLRFCSIVM